MTQELLAFFVSFGETFAKNIPISLGLAAVFTVLTWFWACNPGQAWWHKRDLVTDLCYWFFIPVITRYLRIGMLIVGAAVLFRITTADGLIAFYDNGHGPLAALPLSSQMVIFLVGEDIILYWTHRLFHGQRMWRYHAVHHSSEELEWISAARFHPVNLFLGSVAADVIMLLLGISPNVFVVLGPFNHRTFGLRARQSRLDARAVQIRVRRSGLPPLASHRGRTAAARRTLPRRFRFWTSCSALFICRPASFPITTGSAIASIRRAFRDSSSIRSRSDGRRGESSRRSRHFAIIVKQASPATGVAVAACSADAPVCTSFTNLQSSGPVGDWPLYLSNPRSVSERIDDGVWRARPGGAKRAALVLGGGRFLPPSPRRPSPNSRSPFTSTKPRS